MPEIQTAPEPVAVIYNPEAGSRLTVRPRPALSEVVAALRACGGDVELLPTRKAGDGLCRGEEAARRFPVVAILGGDGTINEVLNGIVAAGCRSRVLLLPGGSINVLARNLGLPLDPRRAAALLRDGAPRRLFLGRALKADGPSASRYFVLMGGAGLDASIVHALAGTRFKRTLGFISFVCEGLRHAAFYPFPQLTITTDNREVTGYMAVVGNSPGYGGWFSLTPQADPGQPGFQVTVITTRSVPKYFYLLGLALTGSVLRSRHVLHFEAPRISIASAQPAWVQLDGECWEPLPVEFIADGTSLDFLVPRATVIPATTDAVSLRA